MQKKFRCVKKYPRGPEVDSIIEEINLGHHRYYELVNSKYNLTLHYFDVENYPEFWEEIKEVKLDVPIGTKFRHKLSSQIRQIISCKDGMVNMDFLEFSSIPVEKVNYFFKTGEWTIYKEKEFEILEFKLKGSKVSRFINKNGFYPTADTPEKAWQSNFNSFTKEQLLIDKDYSINKVRRLSDGVIFQVRDRVKIDSKVCQLQNYTGNIDKFWISDNGDLHVCLNNHHYNIKYAEHYKQPLFLDELGNEMYEEDDFYFVNEFLNLYGPFKIYNWSVKDINHVYFKYKKDAENWVENNKPMFSKKQVLDALNYNTAFCTSLGVFVNETVFKQKLGL